MSGKRLLPRNRQGLWAVLVLAWFSVACSPGTERSGLSSEAVKLCADYQEFFSDVTAGILTVGEGRERIKTIYNRAQGTELDSQSRTMLAAWTGGSESEKNEAIRLVTLKCTGRDIVAEENATKLKAAKEKACGKYLSELQKLADVGGEIKLNDIIGWGLLISIEARGTSVETEANAIESITKRENTRLWEKDPNGMMRKLRLELLAMNVACARS